MGEKWGKMGKKWVRNEITGLQKTLLMHASAHLAGRGHLAGPGGWNYPDSLEVGNAKRGRHLTPAQTRAHFSLWSARATSPPRAPGSGSGLRLGVFADLS